MVFDQLMVLYSGDPPLEVVNRYGHGECVKEMVLCKKVLSSLVPFICIQS